MSSKIVWNDDEKRTLAAYVARNMSEWDDHEAITLLWEAQELLPQERQRPRTSLQGISRVPWLQELVQAEWDFQGESEDQQDTLADETMERLFHEAACDVLRELISEDMVYRAIKEAVEEHLPSNGHGLPLSGGVPNKDRPNLPTVLVVGPKEDQAELLRGQFKGRAAIKVQQNAKHASPKPVEKAAARADHVVVWTRFISHSAYAGVKASGTPYSHVNGGITSVAGAIAHYLRGLSNGNGKAQTSSKS
jgi:hypothetical protein